MEWNEFKEIIPQERYVKIEPTKILIGVLNFRSGEVEHYKFNVEFVRRDRDAVWNSTIFAYGVITYESGNSYNNMLPLCYTNSEELDKLVGNMRKATPMTRDECFEELRKY